MSKPVRSAASKKAPPGKNAGGKKVPAKSAKAPASPSRGKSKAVAIAPAVSRKESKPKLVKSTATKTVASGKARPTDKLKPAVSKPAASRNPQKPAQKPVAAAKKAAPPKTAAVKADMEKTPPAKKSAAPSVAPKQAPRPAAAEAAPAPKAAAPDLKIVPAAKPAKAAAAVPARAVPSEFDGFKVHDHVVYPTHGVGKIVAVEAQEIAGTRLELFVIAFEQEKMTLRVPLNKAKAVGMRVLSSRDTVKTALKTLRGRARIKRTMWSRRAQEYEAKINSGDLLLIAEVVRDLHRAEGQPEQSYSERQIYEAALERLAREVGAVEELDTGAALERVEGALKKAA